MQSKKIGTLNLHFSNENYGAVLQAYALQTYLKNHGYEATIINFLNFPRTPHLIIITIIKSISQNPFRRFRKKWLYPITKPFFWSFQINYKKFDFDTYITGSDQVWRRASSMIISPPTVYYLPFVPKHLKRIAYAVSFGIDEWGLKDAYTEKISQEVNKFDAVSVRELSGLEICREVFGLRDVIHTLDPVLLAGRSYFDKIINKAENTQNNEIVYYKLDPDKDFNSMIEYLCLELQAPVKNIYYSFYKNILRWKIKKYYEVSDWLAGIRDARFVVTDSYHCVCFCILFEKQFICVPNQNRGVTRIVSLLNILGLSERLYASLDEIKNNSAWKSSIDYSKVRGALDLEREKSSSFLINALIG
jgi:hypothetical protein